MRLSQRTMKEQNDNLGGINRSKRNEWAENIENTIRDLAPYPISYDVDSTQSENFSEFSFTEYLGGVMLNTQSIQINTRLRNLASKEKASKCNLGNLGKLCVDKYELNQIDLPNEEFPKHVGIMTGHNLFDLVSKEILSRQVFENDFTLKLHPLTNKHYARIMADIVGWNNIIDNKISGMQLIKNCDVAYVHSATELATVAVLFEKEIVNIGNFLNESIGVYYPITSILFREKDIQERKKIINNLIDCNYSGFIFPWMTEEEIVERIKNFFNKSIELKEIYKDIAPKSNLKKIPSNPDGSKIGE